MYLRLNIAGYTGTAGDVMIGVHNDMQFTTKDRDNDPDSGNCASVYHGAWWYGSGCHHSNINGPYRSGLNGPQGVAWWHFLNKYVSLKFTQMKLHLSD